MDFKVGDKVVVHLREFSNLTDEGVERFLASGEEFLIGTITHTENIRFNGPDRNYCVVYFGENSGFINQHYTNGHNIVSKDNLTLYDKNAII